MKLLNLLKCKTKGRKALEGNDAEDIRRQRCKGCQKSMRLKQ